MTATRWSAVERIFHSALDRPAAERLTFVAGACGGDADLLREVHSLLDQTSRPGFLDEPAIHIAATLIEPPDAAPWTGRRIGVYQLQELLGKGGMGEVYRARDTRLGREVAIKVLPRGFAADADRVARFEREARMLAALNHPHIGTIYGVEESRRAPRAGPGTGRRRDVGRSDRARPAGEPGGVPLGRADRRRARRGAREGHHPPRPEARQHQDHARRRRQGARLRARASPTARRRTTTEVTRSPTITADEHRARHGRLHEPGAGPRAGGGQSGRTSGPSAACSTRC